MKKLFFCLSLALILLPACSELTVFQKEASEAVDNLSSEAVRLKSSVETTTSQVKAAVEATQEAASAIQNASDSIQSIGDPEANEPVPSDN